MIVIPAIDIRNGKVVRLAQGSADNQTVYSDSPIDVAKKWASYGVEMIHIVDLDGALEGNFKNLKLIRDIARSVQAGIELGGGLRDEAMIEKVLAAGVNKVVLGTKALDKKFLKNCVKKFGERIVVGIDVKCGIVYTKGWVFKTKMKAGDFAKEMEDAGVRTINYTDISKDGMLAGPDIKGIEALLAATDICVVAGGGISTIEDVKKLKALGGRGLSGVIIGKALYEGTIDLGEAIRISKN